MRALQGIVAIAIVLVLGFFVWVYSGSYDVAATRPHHGFGGWVWRTVKRQSVRAHARTIEVPSLTEEDMVRDGARLYHHTCAGCHGAPGVESEPYARTMEPPPPDLSDNIHRWTSGELFWSVRNGIRQSGMPAYGSILPEDQTWQVVAFLQQLPGMSPERYQELTPPPQPAEPPPATTPPPAEEAPIPPPEGETPPPQGETPSPQGETPPTEEHKP